MQVAVKMQAAVKMLEVVKHHKVEAIVSVYLRRPVRADRRILVSFKEELGEHREERLVESFMILDSSKSR
jgi:hypothetical protein